MPRTARRLDGLRESVIREMTRLALEHDAVNLAQGFPDFPPPPEIVAAAHAALDEARNQYTVTWGIPPLRQAIADKMRDRFALDVDPDRHVIVTCGVTEAITAAVMAVVDPGDEVVILEPFHENYLPAVTFAGARAVYVAFEPPAWRLDLDRLRAAFGPRTRAILVNTPHNPTGRVLDTEELEVIADLCIEHDAVAITDEIYDSILHDGRVHVPPATLPGMAPRTITIGGLGKTFAVTGWRLGYGCAPEPLSRAMRTMHDFLTICAPAPLQWAAVAAMRLPPAYYAQITREYGARRERMMGILDAAGFTGTPPEAAYYVLTDFGRTPALGFTGDDRDLARWLVRELGVAVVPGSSFYGTPGLGRDKIRWAFAKRTETLDRVEERLAPLARAR